MDGRRFDDFSKAMVTSRRGALKTILGGLLASFGIVEHDEADAQGCKRANRRCSSDAECCSGTCDPTTGRCGCGPGTELCRNDCVDVSSYQTDVRNCGGCNNRCRSTSHGSAICANGECGLECDAGYALCGSHCCPD